MMNPRNEGKTRRSRDGSHTKKNNKTYFGYKGHNIVDDNRPVPTIRSYAVTTAKDHDTSIDLSKHGITVYRDKGYFGHDPKGIQRNHGQECEKSQTALRLIKSIMVFS